MSFNKDNKTNNGYSRISIGLASPEEILAQSSGEVLKPETINYRTYKPERDGLFCERIFGPVKDYECHCGKYKRIRYKGIVCDRCGVEVTEKKVRRERMGSHLAGGAGSAYLVLSVRSPRRSAICSVIPSKKLEAIIYYERYVVINPRIGGSERYRASADPSPRRSIWTCWPLCPRRIRSCPMTIPTSSSPDGCRAIYTLLKQVDLDAHVLRPASQGLDRDLAAA